jgi:hypothetical protein
MERDGTEVLNSQGELRGRAFQSSQSHRESFLHVKRKPGCQSSIAERETSD